MEKDEKKVLLPEVADKYDVIGVPIGTHHFNGFGKIDLTTLDLKRADALVKSNFTWLRAKTKKTAVPELPAPDKPVK